MKQVSWQSSFRRKFLSIKLCISLSITSINYFPQNGFSLYFVLYKLTYLTHFTLNIFYSFQLSQFFKTQRPLILTLMKSPLIVVFGITSILLGLYILVMSLFHAQDQPYHAGCFLSHQPIDLSFRLKNKLTSLKRSGNHSRALHDKLKTFQLIDPEIRTKSVQLTKNTETYIQKMTLIKLTQESNMNFFTQLSDSRHSYENCVTQLRQNLDLTNSKNLWISYQACSGRYEAYKAEIQSLYHKRDRYLKEIDVLLAPEQNSSKSFDFEEQLKKIREKYENLNAQNDKNKETYIMHLKRLQSHNQSKNSEYEQSERLHNRASLQYDICLKNLKQFKKCEDISNALKEYGYVEPVESLQKQIRSKRQILLQLTQLLMESKRDGKPNDAISEMYRKRSQQLLQTMKLNVFMGVDQMKQCGCTEETRSKLEKQLENAQIKMNLHKKEIDDISFDIYKTQKKIKETEDIRERLVRQLTEETEKLKNRETLNILSLKEKLEILKNNLGALNSQINLYNRKLTSLEFECNQYKDRLGDKIKEAEQITQCLKNKDLYDKLKAKAGIIVRKDIETSAQPINDIRAIFSLILYPETREVKKMITFANEVEMIDSEIVETKEKQEPVHEKTLEKQVIHIEREVTIDGPQQKVRIHQEEVITIEPAITNEL